MPTSVAQVQVANISSLILQLILSDQNKEGTIPERKVSRREDVFLEEWGKGLSR